MFHLLREAFTDTKEAEEGFKYYAKTRTVGRSNSLEGGSCTIVPPPPPIKNISVKIWVGGGANTPLATYLGSDGHGD